MLSLMLAVGSTMHAYGLFVVPVSREFDLSRASANTGLILLNAGAAVAALLVGGLIDRYPVRRIMLLGGAVLCAVLAVLGLSHSLLIDAAVLSFPAGFAIAAMGTLSAPALVARWFTARRGRAMAITMMGISGGTVAVVPAIAFLIDRFGWRASLIVMAAVVGIMAAILPALIREYPAPEEVEEPQAGRPSASDERNGERLAIGMILRDPRFWGIGVSVAIAIASVQSMVVTLVPVAVDMGMTTTLAASLMSALGGAGIVGKAAVAVGGDRVDRSIALAGLFLLISLSGAALLIADGYPGLLAASVLAGLSAGATIPLYLALIADEFGAANFGTVNGYMTFLNAIFGAAAVRLSGEVFDRAGSYEPVFLSLVAFGAAAAALIIISRSISKRKAPVNMLGTGSA